MLFGTTPVGFTQVSDTEITTVSPPGTGTVDIEVVTPYGTTPTTPADQFSYAASSGTDSVMAVAVRSASSKAAARAVTTAAISPLSARNPAAVTASLVQTVTDIVYYSVPGLITEKNTTKLLVAARAAAQNYSCQNSQAYLKNLITLAVTPLADELAESLLSPLLIAETGLTGVALPVLLVLMPVTIVAVDLSVDYVVEKIIDAEADAILGNCENSGHTPPGVSGKVFSPDVLFDPSGTVVDSNGTPISGATVTLLRSDTASGTFTAVSPSSPGIQPAVNPETTDSSGRFHWDVSAGYYEIQATAPGCTDAADTSQAAARIGPYPVPPPQVGLAISMACASEPTPPVPVVQGLSQDSGAASGGDTVTVTGTGFTPDASVDFGRTAASSVTYLSPQTLRVVSPASSGSVDVTVHTAGGTSAVGAADQFFFGSPPVVTGLSSTKGPTAGGGTITITGTGFTGATAVAFGPVPATSVTVVSDTQITATIPQNLPGMVDVMVTNPAGTSATSVADQYTYGGVAPSFTAGSPPLTATAGGSYGYAFAGSGQPAPVFALAKAAPAWLTINSSTGQVQGIVPVGTTTFSYTVTATNSTGTATAGPFTVAVSPPVPPRIDTKASAAGISIASVPVATTGPGDLLVAFVAADGPANASQQTRVRGGGLTWTLATREDTQGGDAEVWTATAAKRGVYWVTSALTRPGYEQLTVVAFSDTSGLGKTVPASAASGDPAASLTTSGAGSWVFAVGYDRLTRLAAAPGQTIIAEATDFAGGTYWVQATRAPTPVVATPVEINDITPAAGHWNPFFSVTGPWNVTLIEILAARG